MDHVEEMSLESLRKMQDVQMVVMSETAGKATKGRGEYAWRLEPDGETEMPETRVVLESTWTLMVKVHMKGSKWKSSEGKAKRQEKKVEKFQSLKWKIHSRAPHHCANSDRFRTTGLTSVGSLNRPIQIGIGRYASLVLSPSHVKLSACVQPIRIAIVRHGISSIGAIRNHITKNLTNEFYSKSVLRHIITGSRKGASAIS